MSYPSEYGKKMPGVLPDFATPLNIDTEEADVPKNDMGAIPPKSGFPDPLGVIVGGEGKGKK